MAEAFYENEENLKKLCDFLRGKEGPAVREAIEMDKRVYYLKGKSSPTHTHTCDTLFAVRWLTSTYLVPVGNTA